jgi:hypothetical protein
MNVFLSKKNDFVHVSFQLTTIHIASINFKQLFTDLSYKFIIPLIDILYRKLNYKMEGFC